MKKIFIYSLIVLLLIPISSKAAGDTYTLLEPLPCIPGTATDASGKCVNGVTPSMPLEDYIGYIFKFAIAISAFLAVIMIIWGGFEYITIESFSGKSDAKKRIQDALTGLLMVLASYLILRTIDPRLVEINTNIPAIKIDTSGVKAFRNKLDADLSAITTDAIGKVSDLEKIINDKQKQIDAIDSNHNQYNSEPMTAEEEKNYEQLKQDIATAKKEQAVFIANGTAANQTPLIINATDFASIETAKLKINQNYDAAISLLDPNTDGEKIQELKNQKAVLAGQLYALPLIKSNIADYQKSNISDEQKIANKSGLVTDLNNAKKELVQIDTKYTDPIFKQTCTVIIQNKIDLINAALNLTPKK